MIGPADPHIYGWAPVPADVNRGPMRVAVCMWPESYSFLGGYVAARTLAAAQCPGCLVRLDRLLRDRPGDLDVCGPSER